MTTPFDPELLAELQEETTAMHPQSALAEIGGPAAAVAVVDEWDVRLLNDPMTAPYFEQVIQTDRLSDLKRHQVLILVLSLGGPDRYSGRDLATAHKDVHTPNGNPITESVYRVVYLHLNDILHEFKVPMNIRLSVHELLLSVAHLIVNGPAAGAVEAAQ